MCACASSEDGLTLQEEEEQVQKEDEWREIGQTRIACETTTEWCLCVGGSVSVHFLIIF